MASTVCEGQRPSSETTIRVSPNFQAKQQYYCLLTFAGKKSPSVWLVIDGPRLFLDRNADGNLTDKGELFPRYKPGDVATELTSKPLQSRYTKMRLRWADSEKRALLVVSMLVDGQFRLESILASESLATDPKNAPIVHFGNELQATIFGTPKHALWRGKNARTILPVNVSLASKSSTAGKRAYPAFVVAESLPESVQPVARIAYASKKSNSDPVLVTVRLKTRGSNHFSATAAAPAIAKPGPVKITVSLANWAAATVKPAVVKTVLPPFRDLPVIEPRRKRN